MPHAGGDLAENPHCWLSLPRTPAHLTWRRQSPQTAERTILMSLASKRSPIATKSAIQRVAVCVMITLPCLFSESLSAIQLGYTYSPSRVVVGDKLTFTYRLENDGPADESGTLFTNKLPANTVFV